MTIILLPLLIIALILICVVLSPRSLRNLRSLYLTRRISMVQRLVENRYMYLKRSIIGIERSTIWANIVASLNGRNVFRTRTGEQKPWFPICLTLLSFFLLGLLLLQNLMPNSAQTPVPSRPDVVSISPVRHTNATTEQKFDASDDVVRISQMNSGQYDSYEDFTIWSPSACSAASMTVVMNAYGEDLRIADVLETAIKVNAIDADLGLLERTGINRTVAQYNFQAKMLKNATVDDVVDAANSGTPVIVNFGPQPAWPGGHILVVLGSDEDNVYLADSSDYDIESLSLEEFGEQFTSFAVVVTPK